MEAIAVAVGANGPDGWRAALMRGGRVLASFSAQQARAIGADLIRLADLFEGAE